MRTVKGYTEEQLKAEAEKFITKEHIQKMQETIEKKLFREISKNLK